MSPVAKMRAACWLVFTSGLVLHITMSPLVAHAQGPAFLVKDINTVRSQYPTPGSFSFVGNLVEVNGTLVFTAVDNDGLDDHQAQRPSAHLTKKAKHVLVRLGKFKVRSVLNISRQPRLVRVSAAVVRGYGSAPTSIRVGAGSTSISIFRPPSPPAASASTSNSTRAIPRTHGPHMGTPPSVTLVDHLRHNPQRPEPYGLNAAPDSFVSPEADRIDAAGDIS